MLGYDVSYSSTDHTYIAYQYKGQGRHKKVQPLGVVPCTYGRCDDSGFRPLEKTIFLKGFKFRVLFYHDGTPMTVVPVCGD